jgi:hypothetical protein
MPQTQNFFARLLRLDVRRRQLIFLVLAVIATTVHFSTLAANLSDQAGREKAQSSVGARSTILDTGAFSYDSNPDPAAFNIQSNGSPQILTLVQTITSPSVGPFVPSPSSPITVSPRIVGAGIALPESWLSYNPASLTFNDGGQSKTWTITITVPANATAGSYTANLKIMHPSPSAEANGTALTISINVLPTAAACTTTVGVSDAEVTLCVSQAGTTIFNPISAASAGSLPNGYAFCPNCPAYDIVTTATYIPQAVVCLSVPSNLSAQNYANLKLLHGENGVLVDRTTNHVTDANGGRWVCGNVQSFSPFTLGQGLTPTAADGDVSGRTVDAAGNPVEGVTIRMSGAQNRMTVTDANGVYHFDNVETNGLYTITPARANFSFSPSQRSFSQLGEHSDASFSAESTAGRMNPLDTNEYFVRQQYLDFLNREPDEAGLNFWVSNLEACGVDQDCRAAKLTDTSAAFFLSVEFQQTGYLVYRTYQAAYGNLPGVQVPIKFDKFAADTKEIGKDVVVNQNGWQQVLEMNKQAFALEFVQRPSFISAYPTRTTATELVDKLFANAGVAPSASDRIAAIDEFADAANTNDVVARAHVLRRVAENNSSAQQNFTRALVLMQYFGYLRRNPNDRPEPTLDYQGYNFWLDKLNSFGGDFEKAELVKAFLFCNEYRERFGPR